MNTQKTLTNLVTLLILSTALVSCSSNDSNNNILDANNNPKKLMLSSDGIGPINASTPFNMHKITLAFPDLSVVEQIEYKKGNASPIIRVSKQGNPLLIIYPHTDLKRIFSVVIRDNIIGNSLGHSIGQPYVKIYTYETREPCSPGVEELEGKVLCMAPNSPNILYVFKGQWDGDINKIPPIEVLANWSLEAIVWRPKL